MRVCTVCSHQDRAAIDRALVDGASLRAIAGQYGTNKSALDRHRKHLAPALTLAKQATVVTEATSLLSRVERIMSRCELIAEAATRERDWLPAIAASRELRGCLELLGKLSGEIQSGTRVAVQIINGVPAKMVAVGSPEWQVSFRDYIDEMIADYDAEEARRKNKGRGD
jgi:transposase-like protein